MLPSDLSPNFPPLKSRVLGCRYAHRDGVSRFGRGPFLRSLIAAVFASEKCFLFGLKRRFSSRPESDPRTERRLGQDGPQAPAQRRAAVLTQSSTVPGCGGLGRHHCRIMVLSAVIPRRPCGQPQHGDPEGRCSSCPGRGHRCDAGRCGESGATEPRPGRDVLPPVSQAEPLAA